MKRFLTLLAVTLYFGTTAFAQQDPMFTKYMFNSLTFNPAYAGSKDHLAIGLLHRSQWLGIDGAPETQTLTAHTPLKNERVGVGFNLINDNIGPTSNLSLNLSYAYRIPVGDNGKLSIGMQGGVENYKADFSQLRIDQPGDFPLTGIENRWLPNFGAGVYYYNPKFYAGFSSPQLIEHDLEETVVDVQGRTTLAKQFRHYFLTAGAAIPISGDDLVFKPSFLIKDVSLFNSLRKDNQNVGAPTEFDVDLSMFFYQTLWLGLSYRSAFADFDDTSSNDSIDIWASYFLKNGLRIGAAYDYTLSALSAATSGSFELFLGYEFDYRTERTVTPRYF